MDPFVKVVYRGENPDTTREVKTPVEFGHTSAFALRCLGYVAKYVRPDGRIVALSFEQEPGNYVVWTVADGARYWSICASRQEAIEHAIRCANAGYKS